MRQDLRRFVVKVVCATPKSGGQVGVRDAAAPANPSFLAASFAFCRRSSRSNYRDKGCERAREASERKASEETRDAGPSAAAVAAVAAVAIVAG